MEKYHDVTIYRSCGLTVLLECFNLFVYNYQVFIFSSVAIINLLASKELLDTVKPYHNNAKSDNIASLIQKFRRYTYRLILRSWYY